MCGPSLLEGTRDAREGRVEGGSERIDRSDDCYRNARRDQAVFNCRYPGLIFAELTKKPNHDEPLGCDVTGRESSRYALHTDETT